MVSGKWMGKADANVEAQSQAWSLTRQGLFSEY